MRNGNAGKMPEGKKGAATRDALLDALAALLTERAGVEPGIHEIAQRADVNAGLVRYYFGGKDNMLRALVERDLGGRQAELDALLGADIPIVEKLKRSVSGLISMYYRSPYLNNLILTINDRLSPEESRNLARQWLRPSYRAHKRLLESGAAAGLFRPVDPMLFYFTISGAAERMFSAQYSLQNIFDISRVSPQLKRKMTEHTAELLLRGILSDEALRAYLAVDGANSDLLAAREPEMP